MPSIAGWPAMAQSLFEHGENLLKIFVRLCQPNRNQEGLEHRLARPPEIVMIDTRISPASCWAEHLIGWTWPKS